MNSNVKKSFSFAKEAASWILMILALCMFLYTFYNVFIKDDANDEFYLFGYRPLLVMSDSMEPYMKTNGMVLVKEVSDISEVSVGDVVAFHFINRDGEPVRITHRIVQISGDTIRTKGDNVSSADEIQLTMEDVEAKVVGVFNGTAWLADKWQTAAGKVMVISFAVAAVLFFMLLSTVIQYFKKGCSAQDAEGSLSPSPEQRNHH